MVLSPWSKILLVVAKNDKSFALLQLLNLVVDSLVAGKSREVIKLKNRNIYKLRAGVVVAENRFF